MLAAQIITVLLGFAGGVGAFVLIAMRLPNRARLATSTLLIGAIWALPLVIPGNFSWVRLAILIPIAATVFKMYDLQASARTVLPGDSPDPRNPHTAITFLLATPALGTFRTWRAHQPLPPEDRPPLTDAIPHLGAAALSGAALYIAFRYVDWPRYPFALEYLAKVSLVFVLIPAVTNAMIVLDRRRGLPVRPMFDRIWSAPTPGAFWQRFDTFFHWFMREHVFARTCRPRHPGARPRPVLATLAVFAFSAIGHEVLFSIAIGRVKGYQLAFFMIQGVVVGATLRFHPAPGWQRTLSHAATLAFVLATGTIFFASVQSVLPFFVER